VIHLFNQGIVNVSEALTDPKMAFRKQSVTQLITYHTQNKKQTKKLNKQTKTEKKRKKKSTCFSVCVLEGLTCVAYKNKIENRRTKQKEKERRRVIMQRTNS